MTVATALAVSWNPFENSKNRTRMKQPTRMDMEANDPGTREASIWPNSLKHSGVSSLNFPAFRRHKSFVNGLDLRRPQSEPVLAASHAVRQVPHRNRTETASRSLVCTSDSSREARARAIVLPGRYLT